MPRTICGYDIEVVHEHDMDGEYVNYEFEKEANIKNRPLILLHRLAEIFGVEYTPDFVLSEDWHISEYFEVEQDEAENNRGEYQCWCTTYIKNGFILTRRDVKDKRVMIGSVCTRHFEKNKRLFGEFKTLKRRYRAKEKCKECSLGLQDRRLKVQKHGFCSQTCQTRFETNAQQNLEYEEHFNTWPGLFCTYELHEGFKEWISCKERGEKVTRKKGPGFSDWVKKTLSHEFGYTEVQCKEPKNRMKHPSSPKNNIEESDWMITSAAAYGGPLCPDKGCGPTRYESEGLYICDQCCYMFEW
jgi:hypothetical protein